MKDAKWFTNQVALVTGASGGLGAQIALELAKRDVQLILVARNNAKLEQVAAECKTFTTKPVDVYSCDLTDDASVNQLLATLDEAYKITMVINNAGLGYLKLAKDLSESEINQMLHLNLNTLIKITQHFVPRFIEDKGGVIVNIASQAGKSATVKSSVYSATKFGVLGYSNALRLELKPYGIHVMTVNPGPIATDFFDKAEPTGKYLEQLGAVVLDPAKVAGEVVKGIEREKREVNLPKTMNFASKLNVLFPKIGDRLLGSIFNKK